MNPFGPEVKAGPLPPVDVSMAAYTLLNSLCLGASLEQMGEAASALEELERAGLVESYVLPTDGVRYWAPVQGANPRPPGGDT